MDAFYASVEQRDNVVLKGKPVAVGGSKARGVVAAASYEARKFGVHSAMPSSRAAKLCPQLLFVKPRFNVYKEVSIQIRHIFKEYTDLVEPLSLDEAYLDVTHNKIGPSSATMIAKEIKSKIKERTHLTASAGISYNKFLAKTASDVNKPDGLFVILPEDADNFIAHLPVKKFHGIGHVTAEKMHRAGIFTGADLRKRNLADLNQRFGKMGKYYYDICRGIDMRPVQPHRERKSISAENTFDHDLMNLKEVKERIAPILREVYRRYESTQARGKTITVKIKYGDFRQITRSHTLDSPLVAIDQFKKEVDSILQLSILREEGIRLLGAGISNFVDEKNEDGNIQLTLGF